MENKKIYSKSGYVSEVTKRKDNYIASIGGMDYWSKHDIFNLKGCAVELTYTTSSMGDKIYNWIQNVLSFENSNQADLKNSENTAPTPPREDKYSDNKTLNTCLMVAGEVTKVAYANPDHTPTVNPVDYCVAAFNSLMKAAKG